VAAGLPPPLRSIVAGCILHGAASKGAHPWIQYGRDASPVRVTSSDVLVLARTVRFSALGQRMIRPRCAVGPCMAASIGQRRVGWRGKEAL